MSGSRLQTRLCVRLCIPGCPRLFPAHTWPPGSPSATPASPRPGGRLARASLDGGLAGGRRGATEGWSPCRLRHASHHRCGRPASRPDGTILAAHWPPDQPTPSISGQQALALLPPTLGEPPLQELAPGWVQPAFHSHHPLQGSRAALSGSLCPWARGGPAHSRCSLNVGRETAVPGPHRRLETTRRPAATRSSLPGKLLRPLLWPGFRCPCRIPGALRIRRSLRSCPQPGGLRFPLGSILPRLRPRSPSPPPPRDRGPSFPWGGRTVGT